MEPEKWITENVTVRYKFNQNKELHSIEGPAIVIDKFFDDKRFVIKEYYINGNYYTKEEFEEVLKYVNNSEK